VVFFNYAAMQMVAKIVYYGPGLCGKTTNLKLIYDRTTPASRGEIVSLETETDRTLFFDLLPIDVGVIGGFKTKFQLYTVPGQVFYNVTRKLVLKGVDGIVFVADSQAPMLDANIESFQNLKDNLTELGIPIDQTPIVLQYNKRDLKNISSVDELEMGLNPDRRYVSIESSALTGDGVFETLKEISRQTLLKLKTKVVDQEERKKRENIVSFKLQTEEQDPGETPSLDLDEITDDTIDASGAGGIPDSIDDTIPEENSLPAFKMGDTDYGTPPQPGDSSLPSVNLSDVDLEGAEIEIDATDEFAVDSESWSESEDELKLDFEFPADSDEDTDDVDDEGFDAIEEGDLDSLEMEIPSLDETVKDPNAAPFPNVGSDHPSFPGQELEAPPEDWDETSEEMLLDMEASEVQETPPMPPSMDAIETNTAQFEKAAEELPDVSDPEIEMPQAKAKNKTSKSHLDELANLTRITTRKSGKSKPKTDILDNFLTNVNKGKKVDKIQMTSPLPFNTAQLNCILVDEKNNVVHTQLVKAQAHDLPDGKKEIRIHLEIDIEKGN